MSRASFDRLAAEVYAEYRMKGYSVDRSLYIAEATAGERATARHRPVRVNRRTPGRSSRARR